jgi:hypothetical protein
LFLLIDLIDLIDLYLERFIQTDNTIREVDFGLSRHRVNRAVVYANLTALAELCNPVYLVGLLVVYPAGIRASHVACEATGALCMVNDRANYTPVSCDEQILRLYGSRGDSSERHFHVFRNAKC